MSIMSYNGGAIMAMKGKECVAIASDRRFGIQAQTISTEFDKVFEMGPRLYIGLPGLATDVQTVSQRLKFRLNLYELRENRQVKPKTFLSMVSNLLYSRRFGPYFVEPVIAGLDPKTSEPFIASLDLIGCPMITEDFVVSGTCGEQMYGMCETLYRPNLEPDDLFETISQCLLNAVDRDAVSGWGGVVYVIPVHSYQLVTWINSIRNGRTENQDSPGGVLVLCFPITDNSISGNQLRKGPSYQEIAESKNGLSFTDTYILIHRHQKCCFPI